MPANQPATRDAANPRVRHHHHDPVIMLAVMIVRDIFVRRWGSARRRLRRDTALAVI